MNIFQHLNDIIAVKSNKLANNLEDESTFQPYIVQRWLSMHSTTFTEIVNASSNQLWKAMDDKQMWNKLFISVIPKSKNSRIKYIKKPKKSNKTIDKTCIDYLANRLELSRREVREYIELGVIDIKQVKKELNL